MARQIEAYKLRTELAVDANKGSATLKSFQKDVDNVGKSFEKLGATIERSARHLSSSMKSIKGATGDGTTAGGFLPGLGNISEIIQGIPQIGRLAGGLIRPLTDAAESGIKLNMTLETAAIGFEGVAGSAEKAHEHIKKLQEFGKKSPFRFEGLLEASRFMTAFGFSLDEQIPKLTVWGNAIAASGELSAEKISDVVRAFGQMRMAGRVNAQDMNQLTNANIPGWELLAKSIGKSVAETRKLSESGKLAGDVAVEAITAMMKIDPRYRGMMKKMESTGAGRLSAAQDVLEFAQARATEGLTKNISETLGVALQRENIVDDLASRINTAIAPVSALVTTAATTMLGGGLTEGFVKGLEAGKKAVSDAVTDFALEGIIGTAKEWLGIDSPSTVFIEIGKQSAQGFNIGFAAGLGGFDDVMNGFLGGLRGDVRGLLESLMADPMVQALLNTIKTAEGGQLNVMAGGRTVLSGAKHPGEIIPKSQWFKGDRGPSSAAGLYQITRTNWRDLAPKLGLTNFSDPHQQGLAALQLMIQRGGLGALRSGDPMQMMRLAAKDWSSTPGAKIGGGGQWASSRWLGTFKQFAGGGGGGSGAVPVAITNWGGSGGGWGAPGPTSDIAGGAKGIFGRQGIESSPAGEALGNFVQTVDEGVVAISDINIATGELIKTDAKHEQALMRMGTVTYRAIAPIEGMTAATEENADVTVEALEKMQEAFRKQMIKGEAMLTQLSSAMGQLAGQIPSEGEVGKKRGLFSKILGAAAPFLNFIPVIGPIASIAAGMASQALAGNWGGVVQGAAAGLAPGGAFRRTGGGGSSSGTIARTPDQTTTLAAMGTLIKRQGGGPVYRGHSYVVGEQGPELLTAGLNGMITPGGGNQAPMPVEVVNWPGEGGGKGKSNTALNFLTGGLIGTKLGSGWAAGGLFGALINKRSSGGPVYRGHSYLVGEHQAEIFSPGANGYISPSAGRGGGEALAIAQAAAELRAAVAHLNTMPAHQVVMRGARGLVRAMDHDAGLIRLVSQRQRLA